MAFHKYIHPLIGKKLNPSAGKKGICLQRMVKLGMRVPSTYYCDWEACQHYLAGDQSLLKRLENELHSIIVPSGSYAIRSSANVEDGGEHSFAGQFETLLDVRGVPAILEAIQKIWQSLTSSAVQSYLETNNLPDDGLRMAVLIQEMVSPLYSGVAFSKNPVTGADEVVIEAVFGTGSQLVQDGVTPDRWVNKWGYWLEKDEDSQIPFSLIEEIALQIQDISNRVGCPIDTEWVYDGSKLFWVQMREITTIRYRNVYSNHMAKEMMPGMNRPLSFSISAIVMTGAMLRWLQEILGPISVNAQSMVKSFYYHTYFNMGELGKIFQSFGFPAEMFELLMGVLPRGAAKTKFKPSLKTFSLLPSAFAFFLKKAYSSNRVSARLDELETLLKAATLEDLEKANLEEIHHKIQNHNRLMDDVGYHTTLSLFLLSMFNRALRRQLNRRGVDISKFDITENMKTLEEFYPTQHLRELNQLFRTLSPELQELVRTSHYLELVKHKELVSLTEGFNNLLERFGHLGNSGNDFSVPTWRETPQVVLTMITNYQMPAEDHSQKLRLQDLKERHQVNPFFMFFYNRSREYQYLREKASSLYTRGKMLYRIYYLAVGRKLVAMNLLDNAEDIFYLTPDEVTRLALGSGEPINGREIAALHKENMERYKGVQLPTVIYGDEPPPVYHSDAKVMIGVPTSLGCYTGRVCVIKGEQDFSKLKQGEVLVIPYSDVSWAPLFSKAGALISESGGILSHGSIVAREYNIPAIVSVDQATGIPDGTLVTVDAQQGVVLIVEEAKKPIKTTVSI
ncbi:MAG TPA: PEP/pyruvate-binding domain-containing protein [Anaerolineaceae bacterium]|nr:PEP/pyruvate-binding domain-containing protein [Anaerolineaceae bacterium]